MPTMQAARFARLLALALAACALAAGDEPGPASLESLTFSSPFDEPHIPGWEHGGAVSFGEDYFELTPQERHKLGWLWSTRKVRLTEWQVEIEFYIGGAENRGAGGGMAFWLTTTVGKGGAVYGHADSYEGLGVFFDTYESEDGKGEPFVVAMVGVGDDHGKHSGEGSSSKRGEQVGICFAQYRNKPHPIKARVSHRQGRLHVALALDEHGHFSSCLSTTAGDARVRVPAEAYVGVTASTGEHADSHAVYAMTFLDLSPEQPAARDLPDLPHEPQAQHETTTVGGEAQAKVVVGEEAEQAHKAFHPGGEEAPLPSDHVDPPSAVRKGRPGSPDVGLEQRLARVEQALSKDRAEAARRHNELMGSLRSTGGSGAPPRGGDGLHAEVAELKALVAELTKGEEGGLRALMASIEGQMQLLAEGLKGGGDGAQGHMSKIAEMLEKSSERLHALQREQAEAASTHSRYLKGLEGNLRDLTDDHESFRSRVTSDLSEAATAIKSGVVSYFWWIFLLFQIAFVSVFLFYKRATDFKKIL